MKILIVKLGAIGDIVHTLPVLAELKREFPSAEVSWVAESRSAEILRENSLIEHLIEVDTRTLRNPKALDRFLIEGAKQIKSLRGFDFDIAIDFQGLLKSGMIAKLSGAAKRWGFSRPELREPAAWVFYTDTAKAPKNIHVIRRNLSLAGSALGVEFAPNHPQYPIFSTDEDKEQAAAIARRVGERFAILNPAGGWVTKLWDAGKYGELADMLWEKEGLESLVVSGPKELELSSAVIAEAKSGKATAVQIGLKGFFELAKLSEIYVGGDTGPTHLAIAAGTPVVAIFGPTEWWRNGSLNPDDLCVERTDIGCRVDCHRRTCSNWICMDIAPERVFDAVRTRLAMAGMTTAPSLATKILG